MSDSDNGKTTQPKTGVLIEPSPILFACSRRSNRRRTSAKAEPPPSKNRSSASQRPASSIKDPYSEEDDTPHYFTNLGPRGELVPVDHDSLAETLRPDRAEMYQIIRLYEVQGITWAVCDDCAINRFPRVFEGSKIVARVGCAHCRCQNALRDEAAMQRWLSLGRPPINLSDPPAAS